jgi:ribonuclease T2
VSLRYNAAGEKGSLGMKRKTIWAILVIFCVMTFAFGRKHSKGGQQGSASFDYYLLSLSWAPNYCASNPTDSSSECKAGNHTAFVLHGLWPSSNNNPMQPLSCAPARPVASDIVQHMLEYFPDKGLIQHEWAKHGTCSGLTSAQYFGKVEQAFKAVQVPDRYKKLTHSQQISVHDVEQEFAQANNAPAEAFRLSCHAEQLVALEACLDKDLHYQECPAKARECPSSQVKLAPPK